MKRVLSAALAAVVVICTSFSPARAETLNGTWSIWTEGNQQRLELSWSNASGSSHESTSRDFDPRALGIASALASGGAHAQFSIHREAGDFAMNGWVGNGKGGGTYVFTPNAAFFDDLRKRGIVADTPEDQLAAADLDITRAFIGDVSSLGLNLDFRQLVTFRALGIDRAYVDGLRSQGLRDLDVHEVVSLKALRVDGDYIAMLASAGYPHLSGHQYVTLKALHVDSDFLKRLASHGYTHLTVEQLVNYKALGIQ